MRRALSWALAVLAAVALMTAVVAAYADREVFDADAFAAHAEEALRQPAVSAEVARRLTDAAIRAEPDLVAIRPLVVSVAEGVVRSSAFGALVRGAVRDVHRSAFDADATTVTLTVADVGLLLADALDSLRPDLAARIPDTLRVALTDRTAGVPLDVAQTAQDVHRLGWIALVVALVLAAAAIAVGGAAPRVRAGGAEGAGGAGAGAGGAGDAGGAGRAGQAGGARRDVALRLGVSVGAVAGLTAIAATLAPHVVTGDRAARAVLDVWLEPLAARCWIIFGAALLLTTAAASLWRPPPLDAVWARVRGGAARMPPPLRAFGAIALGIVALAEPSVVLRVLVMAAGAVAVLWGTTELLRQVSPGAPVGRRRVALRPVVVGVGVLLVVGAATAYALSGGAEPVKAGRCNGEAALCAKPLDQVAFLGTHNSMSADGEPGWLFPAQNAGITQQLDDGVRSLLIDTHYGFQTPRGVATDLERDSKSREKVVSELGEAFVETAQRLRARIGFTGDEPREIFLCHAFCEVGATKAIDALRGVHEWLVAHPEEVLILSIEDDTDAQDTARLIRDSGLIREVYTGPAKPPWPTLQQLIERNQRVLVLIENEPGDEPWMHRQDAVTQETPYHFATAAELAAPDSCQEHRGGDAGSLLLVNHWVDTSPAPRRTIAREVNARAFLTERLERCRRERGLLPTVVAVDFYRDGDALGTVRELNR
ncbi:hypothetical protein C8N24_4156 [Solirubrobacter pauli]|uniref:Uncharacterized protein n=1 Tax=Solirubrobacter pauli TaxID=166793 RepID=A0A660KWV8_9ACTN|nr:hypothetical protein [Solirubrobacter pauli]RKQ86146.1 hypothetical protein C8N24_4156 [Solirubrobacter pauli]